MLNFISSKLFDNDNLENDLSVYKAEMIFPKQSFLSKSKRNHLDNFNIFT